MKKKKYTCPVCETTHVLVCHMIASSPALRYDRSVSGFTDDNETDNSGFYRPGVGGFIDDDGSSSYRPGVGGFIDDDD